MPIDDQVLFMDVHPHKYEMISREQIQRIGLVVKIQRLVFTPK
jgi:hypothetical protein